MAQLHYGDQEACTQVNVDHDAATKLQGEGYGVQVHHKRNDVFTADKDSPADVSASSFGNLEVKQEAAFPMSGEQPNQVTMPIKDEGYTSLGIEESQDDNSENSLGVPSEEGTNMKDREGIDLSQRNTDEVAREREGTPNGILGSTNTEEQEEREGAPQGSYNDEQVERNSAPHESSMAKELEGDSAAGGGIIDVQSLKEDYVDLSDGNTHELKGDDPIKASHAHTSPKQSYSVDDPKQEFPIDHSSNQEDFSDHPKQEYPIDDAKQEHSKACPNNDDTHDCESFQGDDGKDKIKAESYNIYTGEPDNVIYDVAEVLGDGHEISTYENEADAAMKPHEGLSAQEESSQEAMQDVPKQVSGSDIMENEQDRDFDSKEHDEREQPFTEHVSLAVKQDAGFKLDSKEREEDASERANAENVSANEESPYTECDRTDSSAVEQDAGFKVDSKDREEEANERENVKNVPESPYTEFDGSDDYVKASYGAEGFVPKQNKDEDSAMREPTEKVDQEEGRRPTDEHPLDKTPELDNVEKQEENGEMASSGDAHGTNVKGIAHGKDDDDSINIDVPQRPPSLPHPQPEDLTEAFNNKNNSSGDDGQQINHEAPHKKGVFEKIKEKITTSFTSS